MLNKLSADVYSNSSKTLEEIYNDERERHLRSMTCGEWLDYIVPKLIRIEVERKLNK